jgi:hypothetical protein
VREADVQGRALFAQDLSDAQLVLRFAIGVDERHRDRLDVLLEQRAGERTHCAFVERQEHAAIRRHALRRLEPRWARDQWRGGDHLAVILVESVLNLISATGVPTSAGGFAPPLPGPAAAVRVGGTGGNCA